jgi:hypothetical protein
MVSRWAHVGVKLWTQNPSVDVYLWGMLKDNMYSKNPRTEGRMKEIV